MEEIKQFMTAKTKIPKLKPLPVAGQFDKEECDKNPLLHFHIAQKKKRDVQDYLKKLAAETKVDISKYIQEEEEECVNRKPDYFFRLLREEAEAISPPQLLKSWENHILKLLPNNLCVKFPAILNSEMMEKREVFESTLRKLGVCRMLQPLEGEIRETYQENYFLTGRTRHYCNFLKRRAILRNTLFLTHHVLRAVLDTSVLQIPDKLIDFSKYRNLGVIDVSQLLDLVNGDLKKSDDALIVRWYPKVVEIIFQKKKVVAGVPGEYLSRFVKCASNLMAVQITESMRRTIAHVLDIASNEHQTPFLNIEIYYDKTGIGLKPTQEELFATYHQILDVITKIGQEFPCLEHWTQLPQTRECILVEVTSSYMQEAHKKLDDVLNDLFRPIKNYINSIAEEFYLLYDEAVLADINAFLSEKHTFDECLEKVHYFEKYVGKIKNMLLNVDFPMARLSQLDLIRNLRGFASAFIADLEKEMIESHRQENVSICEVFEELTRQAVVIPQNSEELIAMGKYMLYASTTLMNELKLRIQSQLEKLSNLLDMRFISDDHMHENAVTVSWVSRIQPVFDENAAMFEQYKFEFEEEIVRRSELVRKGLDILEPKLFILNYMEEADHVEEYILKVRMFLGQLSEFMYEIAWINKEEKLFQFPISIYSNLDEFNIIVNPFAHLIYTVYQWQLKYKVWMDGPFSRLHYEEVVSDVKEFCREITDAEKYYAKLIRKQTSENDPKRFLGSVDDPEYVNLPAPLKLCSKTWDQLEDFKQYFIYIKILCNPALTQRHWNEMSDIVGFDITPNFGTTLRKMINMDLAEYLNEFEGISIAATKELELKRALDEMIRQWEKTFFILEQYRDTEYSSITNIDPILIKLDEDILKSYTLKSSIYVKPYEREMNEWIDRLERVNRCMIIWQQVQCKWIYFLPIFLCKDLLSQMPQENTLWQKVDNMYKVIIVSVQREPQVMATAEISSIYDTLDHCLPILDDLHKGVEDFFNMKRVQFPRLFFLSNDEMVEIITEAKDIKKVLPYMKKLFSGIATLNLDIKLNIQSISSAEGENLKLLKQVPTVSAGNNIDIWLCELEKQMVSAMRESIKQNMPKYYDTPLLTLSLSVPGQTVLCVAKIDWTAKVQAALGQPQELQELIVTFNDQIKSCVTAIKGKLPRLTRLNLTIFILRTAYSKNIINELIEKGVKSEQDFEWMAHLRYYWENDTVVIRCINATLSYSFEYHGNLSRIVITAQTTRCYRALITAFYQQFFVSPCGRTGVGKTETIKDLAKLLGVFCIEFNCNQYVDVPSMSKFFKGIASSGAWACFEDFDNIPPEVLSVIAQQVATVVRALQAKLKTFFLDGTELPVKNTCFASIAINTDYAVRSVLPENLKIFLRNVAMFRADTTFIAKVTLHSFGFDDSDSLSVKLITTLDLCHEMLSTKCHYDFGLCALKAVLLAVQLDKLKHPNEKEDVLVIKAMFAENYPKLLPDDQKLFENIMINIFGIAVPEISNEELQEVVFEICKEMNLQAKETFRESLVFTYEMMKVRHGLMIVGDTFSGKSSILKVLREMILRIDGKDKNDFTVDVEVINPKSLTVEQLYGWVNTVSYRWTDGVISAAFRKFSLSATEGKKLIIFDGPIDGMWVENLNTVLADDKKFCLSSGESIWLHPSVSLIFEVMNVAQASPTTVCQCGIIYADQKMLGWQPLVTSWINKQNPRWIGDYEKICSDLFDWLLPPCLDFIFRRKENHVIKLGMVDIAKTMMDMIRMLMDDALVRNDNNNNYVRFWIQAAYVFSGSWAIGSILDIEGRVLFDAFYKSLWKETNPDYPVPRSLEKVDISVPTEGIIIDHMYIFEGKGKWGFWGEVVRTSEIKERISIQQTLIPTTDAMRCHYIMEMHINHKIPILLVGPTRNGKTFYFHDLIMWKLPQDIYAAGFLTLSAKITANETQSLVISKMEKQTKGLYGPPEDKNMIIFIDDLNAPVPEDYGAQPPLELIRFFIEQDFWFDFKDITRILLNNVMFVAAMQTVGPIKYEVSPRLLRHFNVFAINSISNENLGRIYSNVLLISLKRNGFSQEVLSTVQSIVTATISLWELVRANFFPTPIKSHYIFEMRDISKVVYGCSMIKKPPEDQKKTFYAKIWMHETMRVFYDKMVNDEDRAWIFDKIYTIAKQKFPEPPEVVLSYLPSFDGQVTEDLLKELMFGKYFDSEESEEAEETDVQKFPESYQEIAKFEDIQNCAESVIEEYNEIHCLKMDYVLFRSALEQLYRICRILVTPCANCLLIGPGGSGRQSLVRLAAEITKNVILQPVITEQYDLESWRSDLKKIMVESGGRNKEATFLFSDFQVKYEDFLEDINNLLNTGEVPNIFTNIERQKIYDMVRSAAQGGISSVEITLLASFQFFMYRVKKMLHVMICFDPTNKLYRKWLWLYPNLVSCCNIILFQVWSEDALELVAKRYLNDALVSEETKESAVNACKYFHYTASTVQDDFYGATGLKSYISSSNFLLLVKSFTYTFNTKEEEKTEIRAHYMLGLDKLKYAAGEVQKLLDNLLDLRRQLAETIQKVKDTRQNISNTEKQLENQIKRVEMHQDIKDKQQEATEALRAKCDEILGTVKPVLDDALQKMNSLKSADTGMLKGMKMPPDPVRLVMGAICVLKDVKPDRISDPTSGKKSNDYWGPSKRLLGDWRFLISLKEFDIDNIPPPIMKKLRREFLNKPEFDPKSVGKASKAAEAICWWLKAVDKYNTVLKILTPKREEYAAAKEQLSVEIEKLELEQAAQRNIEAKLQDLNKLLQETLDHQASLEEQEAEADAKWQRADKLIRSLEGERIRWSAASDALKKELDTLPGNVLISCGVIAYLSPYTAVFRNKCILDWHDYTKKLQIPSSEVYCLKDALGTEMKTHGWIIAGLPSDHFSLENAVMVDNSQRWSLMVDPQTHANKWIKSMEKKNGLEVIKFTDSNYMTAIETCITFGRPILLENVLETLESPLDPILLRQTYLEDGVLKIKLNKEMEYNPKFRLYITTKLRCPRYPFHIYNKVTLVNFTLTIEGLEQQLLAIVVKSERPDMEDQRQSLSVQLATFHKKLEELEEDIFATLAESVGNILEDDYAIQVLNNAKLTAIDIHAKEDKVNEANAVIAEFRDQYISVAKHSAVLYYCINDLIYINYVYQYSLEWFLNLYTASCTKNLGSLSIEERLQLLRDTFTISLYQQICQSLFDRDKILFSFILCTRIMIAQNDLPRNELMFMTTDITETEETEPNPATEWLSEDSWIMICHLQELTVFNGFKAHFQNNLENWKSFSESSNPLAELPSPWSKNLSDFQILILIRILNPQKLVFAVTNFVYKTMGKKFVNPPQFDIEKAFDDSDVMCPLIFILTPGADPIVELHKFAKRKEYESKFITLSLGQGQDVVAQTTIRSSQVDGSWVCLQNCHLAPEWMPALERIWETIDNNNSSPGFRLWLTTNPTETFPRAILQNGIKLMFEPPIGLKKKLFYSYKSELLRDPEVFEGCRGRYKEFSRLLYALCFFHAVVCERRLFGTIGWGFPYHFNDSDLYISVNHLQMFINDYKEVPYETIQFMIGECDYGGRVIDEWDWRTLVTLLSDFLNKDVVNTQNYIFSDADKSYSVPPDITYTACLEKIDSLPSETVPEVYGLNKTSGFIRDVTDARIFMDSLYVVHAPIPPDVILETEEALLSIANNILQQLPEEEIDVEDAAEKYPASFEKGMNIILIAEIRRYNNLLGVIRSTTKWVCRALTGELLKKSKAIEQISNEFLSNKTPEAWLKVSYPSIKPLGSYISDFVNRYDFIRGWYENGRPVTFWLPGLFSIHSFLTALLQTHSVTKKIPINDLSFDCIVLPQSKSKIPPRTGIYISGLYLEGARWDEDRNTLTEQEPKVLYDNLPTVHLFPEELSRIDEYGKYKCPCYLTSARQNISPARGLNNIVTYLLLPTQDKPVKHWIKRGVAVLCQTDE